MSRRPRRNHSPALKAEVALAAIKGEKTLSDLAEQIEQASILSTCWQKKGSLRNGLVDLGYGYFRIDHSKNEFSKGGVHINGIEGFWGFAKVRLAKFKGLPDATFHFHLTKTE